MSNGERHGKVVLRIHMYPQQTRVSRRSLDSAHGENGVLMPKIAVYEKIPFEKVHGCLRPS
ncbi:hypothetical protein E4U30_001465 [Claviceps sp. LM220 group G6]|nr:hypothetical protein E4U30_001465 [Claviceps sp. LM220 group G6]